jgi:hypothetical protein
MNLEDIKVGTELISKSKIAEIDGDNVILQFTAPLKFRFVTELCDLLDAQPCPKHDPCRLLREGDKVQVIARNGRCWGKTGEYLRGAYCFVLEDEERNDMVKVRHNSSEYTIDPAYLELVTPAEEMEPYSVETCQYGYTVNKGELILATYNDENHPHAKEAAEAERDRLNAEWRKEQSDD